VPQGFRRPLATNAPVAAAEFRLTADIYTGSKCNWWEIHDGLPRFDTE
jgi:hypothetical protein